MNNSQLAEPAIFASAVSDRSYFIRLSDNTLVMIDGGWRIEDYTAFDHHKLYHAFVNELQRICGTETVTVRAWFITHPHFDHANFLEKVHEYGFEKYFKVERIIRNTPADEDIPESVNSTPILADLPSDREYVHILEDAYQKWTDAEQITAKTGMKFSFSGMDFEILLTPDDILPAKNINALSLLIMQSCGDRRILWTGDMSTAASETAMQIHGDRLKCDVVQVSHHGWGGAGSYEFYELCGASVQLWTNSEYGFKYADPNQGYGKTEIATKVYDMPCCRRHIFCGGIRMEKLPLTEPMYNDFEEKFKL